MLLLKWLWIGNGHDGDVPPIAVFWTLRVLMFILSFVLEDWAIHELVPSPRHRRVAMLLVASSYVTWTFQTHTFSNSIETLVVAWSLVLIERIVSKGVSRNKDAKYITIISDFGLATILDAFLRHTRHGCCFRCIQSYHLSSVPIDTRLETIAAFLE
jgi:GPI mannosyltransferase 4